MLKDVSGPILLHLRSRLSIAHRLLDGYRFYTQKQTFFKQSKDFLIDYSRNCSAFWKPAVYVDACFQVIQEILLIELITDW